MTNETQQPKKTSTGMLVLMVAGGCLLLGLFMAIGKGLGYAGVVLGLLGAGGSVALLMKKPGLKKVAIWGALMSALLVILSFRGADENKKEAAQHAAAVAATEKKAADDKAKLDKAVAALSPDLSGDALVTACADAEKAGGIPAAQAARCGGAFLAAGQSALASKRAPDAVPLLEAAVKIGAKGDEAKAALKEAKVAIATERATAELKRANAAWAAKDYRQATIAADSAQQAAAEGLKEKPDDADLKELSAKVEPIQKRAAEWKQAGEVVKLAGDYDYEYSNGALIVSANHVTDGEFKDILVSGHQALKLMAQEGFEKMPALQSITVVETHSYLDARGNTADGKKVAELKVSRKNAKTIGWDNITPRNLYKALDKAWVDPRVGIEDSL